MVHIELEEDDAVARGRANTDQLLQRWHQRVAPPPPPQSGGEEEQDDSQAAALAEEREAILQDGAADEEDAKPRLAFQLSKRIRRAKRRRVDFEQRKGHRLQKEEILNSSDEEDEQDAKWLRRTRQRFLPAPVQQEDEEQILIAQYKASYTSHQIAELRRDYWINQDRRNHWCFICSHKRSVPEAERFQDFDQLQTYIEGNAPAMDLTILLKSIQDAYIHYFQPFLGPRSIDLYTGAPKPPHHWHLEDIHAHFTQHEINIALHQELTLRSVVAIQMVLEQNVIETNELTDKPQTNKDVLKQYLELLKYKDPLLRAVGQQRANRLKR
jgi:hypothetical protein